MGSTERGVSYLRFELETTRWSTGLYIWTVSRTKHVWYSEHGTYYRFEFILERVMSATHVAVILRTRTSPAYEEEFTKMDYPDARKWVWQVIAIHRMRRLSWRE